MRCRWQSTRHKTLNPNPEPETRNQVATTTAKKLQAVKHGETGAQMRRRFIRVPTPRALYEYHVPGRYSQKSEFSFLTLLRKCFFIKKNKTPIWGSRVPDDQMWLPIVGVKGVRK